MLTYMKDVLQRVICRIEQIETRSVQLCPTLQKLRNRINLIHNTQVSLTSS